MKSKRYSLLPVCLSVLLMGFTALSQAQSLYITEIMYNPPESGTDSLEYIEIYNAGTTAFNLEGYSMTGVTLTFPSFTIPAGGYGVVVVNDTTFANVFPTVTNYIQATSGGLSNSGELIEIKNPNGVAIASVTYGDTGDWPIAPDGAGASLELCAIALDPNNGLNWRAATNDLGVMVNGVALFGTPGAANTVSCTPTADAEVIVANFSFTPADITIYEGQTVVWTNTSGTHNINGTQATFSDNPESFGNSVAAAPWTYTHTFLTVGYYNYQCDPHAGSMQGTVTVLPNAVLAANDDTYTTNYNVPLTLDVLSNDALIEGYTYTVLTQPTLGTLNAAENLYTPNGICGTDSFTYMLQSPDNQIDTATVTINVINCPLTYPEYPIGLLNTEDANGVADSLDVLVRTSGIVHGINNRATGLQFTIIDINRDGIGVFSGSNNFGYTVTEGDIVTVEGRITQFNGLTQVTADTVYKTGTGTPFTPRPVTALGEDTESDLVLIYPELMIVDPSQWTTGTGAGGFTVNFKTLTNQIIAIRIDNDNELYNMPNPGGTSEGFVYQISGIGGQFDNSSPYTDGYQLLPRYEEDINIVIVDNTYEADRVNVTLSPNPAMQVLQIETTEKFDTYYIYTVQGQLVANGNYNQCIAIQSLENGQYILKLLGNRIVGIQPFIKQ